MIMVTLQNYTDTKCELEIAKNRLRWLLDKKEELYSKYFKVTSKIKEVSVSSHADNDNMARYVHELHEIDIGTGKSLGEEIDKQQKLVVELEKYINAMNETLGKMSGIEYQLFYEIVFKGVSISKAVDKISTINNKDSQTIWKNHYRKIKKYVYKILKYTVKLQ